MEEKPRGGGGGGRRVLVIPSWLHFIISETVEVTCFLPLLFSSFSYCHFFTCVLFGHPGCPCSCDHTPHHTCHRPTRQGQTSSDLANKRSINGAVKRVTHASQNLLRSKSPLQLPLHWSNPWAASQNDWPEDSHSVMESQAHKKN